MGAEVGVGVAAEVDVREAVGAEVGEGDRKIAELGVVPAPAQPPVANTAATQPEDRSPVGRHLRAPPSEGTRSREPSSP